MIEWGEDLWNRLSYEVYEHRLAHVVARCQHRLGVWRRAWQARRARRPQVHPVRKETRMEDLVHTAVPPAMLGRALLAKLDAESRTAVIAAVSEEVRKEVHEAAVAEARQALEQAYADKHEALLDDLDRQRKEIERDAAAVADAEAAKQLQLDEEGFQDQLDTVRGQRQAWRARAETAEGLVVSLLTQLCGGLDQTPVYLRTITNEGLVELDRASINAVLGRSGLVLKSKATASARTVQTTLEPGQVQAHSLFWLTKAPAPGVVVAEDPDGPEKG